MNEFIEIRGARENNLKDVSLRIVKQPGSEVLDSADIGAAESNPAFLDSILCFARADPSIR